MSFANLEDHETPVFGQYSSCNDMLITSKPMLHPSLPAFEEVREREQKSSPYQTAVAKDEAAVENPEEINSYPEEVAHFMEELDQLETIMMRVKQMLKK